MLGNCHCVQTATLHPTALGRGGPAHYYALPRRQHTARMRIIHRAARALGVSWCEEKFERRKKRDRGKKEKKKRSKGSTDDAPANFLLFRMHCIANFVRMHCRPARRSNGNRRDPTQPTTADGAYVSDLREVELLLPPLSRSHRSRTGEPHPGRESPRPMYYGWWFLAQTMVDGWRGRIAIP